MPWPDFLTSNGWFTWFFFIRNPYAHLKVRNLAGKFMKGLLASQECARPKMPLVMFLPRTLQTTPRVLLTEA